MTKVRPFRNKLYNILLILLEICILIIKIWLFVGFEFLSEEWLNRWYVKDGIIYLSFFMIIVIFIFILILGVRGCKKNKK